MRPKWISATHPRSRKWETRLGKWRHNNVLRVIAEAVEKQVDSNNKAESPPRHRTAFVKEGAQSRSYSSTSRTNILSSATDWRVKTVLDGKGGSPREILMTALRPDVVVWSEVAKEVIIGELTVPWEGNIDEAHERKLAKYSDLRAECND